MSKERLEEVTGQAQYIDLTINPPINLVKIKVEDFHWLIEQAERVHGKNHLMGLAGMYEDCNRMVADLTSQNKRYREALELIADKREVDFGNNYTNKTYNHSRKIARKALGGE